MVSVNPLAELVELVRLVRAMRDCQRLYFLKRDRASLLPAVEAEKRVDDFLKTLEPEVPP